MLSKCEVKEGEFFVEKRKTYDRDSYPVIYSFLF